MNNLSMGIKRTLYILLILIIMGIIYLFSDQPFKSTMGTSDIIVKPIESTLKEKDDTSFEDKKAEDKYWLKIEKKLNKIVRKSAHIFLFGILCVFVFLMFRSFNLSYIDSIMLAFIFCGIYGAADEWHQSFIEGRTSQFYDICVDEMGAVLSQIFIWAGLKIRSKFGNK